MRRRSLRVWVVLGILAASAGGSEPKGSEATAVDRSAAERGRIALTLTGFLKPEWSESAYRNAGQALGPAGTRSGHATRPAMRRPSGIGMACIRPPTLTTACPWVCAAGSVPAGPRRACKSTAWLCHGGSIGGKSYVGLGNTQLDLRAVLNELTTADGRRPPLSALHPEFVPRNQ